MRHADISTTMNLYGDVFGAGPVGLLSVYCALLKGASEVYIIDSIPERLAKASELGAIAVDFSKGDPVEQIYRPAKEKQGNAGEPTPG